MESKLKGRRFSKREVTDTPDGGELVRINWDDHLTRETIERHLETAKGILVAAGVDVDGLLVDSPHGSLVRDHVLNYSGKEPDSREGLAAQILEHCLHVNAYQAIDGGSRLCTGAAYKLGRLLMLFQAYEIGASQPMAASKKPRPNSRDPFREKIVEALRACRSNGMTFKQAMAALCASGHDDLTFESIHDGYRVLDDAGEDGSDEQIYKPKNLEGMFTEAGSKKKKS